MPQFITSLDLSKALTVTGLSFTFFLTLVWLCRRLSPRWAYSIARDFVRILIVLAIVAIVLGIVFGRGAGTGTHSGDGSSAPAGPQTGGSPGGRKTMSPLMITISGSERVTARIHIVRDDISRRVEIDGAGWQKDFTELVRDVRQMSAAGGPVAVAAVSTDASVPDGVRLAIVALLEEQGLMVNENVGRSE